MEKHPTFANFRAKVRLNQEQRAVMGEYLTRTTLLWNFLHQHLTEAADTYMARPDSEAAEAEFLAEGLKLKDMVLAPTVIYGETEGIHPEWASYIDRIRELPPQLVHSRVMDLIHSYQLAKAGHISGQDNQSDLPRRKSQRSSQSVRFFPEDYTLENGKLTIKSIYPLTIDVPDFANLTLTIPYSLSITRRRIHSDVTSGPADEEMKTYVITLRAI